VQNNHSGHWTRRKGENGSREKEMNYSSWVERAFKGCERN
jgi:hypothetical protein